MATDTDMKRKERMAEIPEDAALAATALAAAVTVLAYLGLASPAAVLLLAAAAFAVMAVSVFARAIQSSGNTRASTVFAAAILSCTSIVAIVTAALLVPLPG